MKKTALAIAAAFAAASSSPAQIAVWTFEPDPIPTNVTNSSIGPFSPAIGSGSFTGTHASASTAWSSPSGNGSSNSLSANNWAIGDYFQFQFSTLTFSNIGITFDQTRSGTGPTNWAISYSIDGSSFTNFSTYGVSNITWNATNFNSASTYSFDFSAVTTLNNQSNVFFRLASSETTPSAGTSRVDNFSASVVPEPSSIALLSLAGLGLAGYAARRRLRR